MRIRQDCRKFEINHAEASVGLAIGDVACVGIVVANAESLQFSKQLPQAFLINMLDAGAAVCGHDPWLGGIGFEQAGDKAAAARFEMAKHADFVREALGCVRTVVSLDHPAIESQVDRRPKCVLYF